MEKIVRIIIICIGICGLILLAMYLYGFINGWIEVLGDDPVSVAKARVIRSKLDNMINPIIKAGYDKGLRTNDTYVSARSDSVFEDLAVARYRLEAAMGW